MGKDKYGEWRIDSDGKDFVLEAKRRGLDCNVNENITGFTKAELNKNYSNKTVITSNPKTQNYTKHKPSISSAELNEEICNKVTFETLVNGSKVKFWIESPDYLNIKNKLQINGVDCNANDIEYFLKEKA